MSEMIIDVINYLIAIALGTFVLLQIVLISLIIKVIKEKNLNIDYHGSKQSSITSCKSVYKDDNENDEDDRSDSLNKKQVQPDRNGFIVSTRDSPMSTPSEKKDYEEKENEIQSYADEEQKKINEEQNRINKEQTEIIETVFKCRGISVWNHWIEAFKEIDYNIHKVRLTDSSYIIDDDAIGSTFAIIFKRNKDNYYFITTENAYPTLNGLEGIYEVTLPDEKLSDYKIKKLAVVKKHEHDTYILEEKGIIS